MSEQNEMQPICIGSSGGFNRPIYALCDGGGNSPNEVLIGQLEDAILVLVWTLAGNLPVRLPVEGHFNWRKFFGVRSHSKRKVDKAVSAMGRRTRRKLKALAKEADKLTAHHMKKGG